MCSGQQAYEIGICETCPQGCQSTICSCSVHRTVNVNIKITETLFEWLCGSEQNWNILKDAIEGDFVLNLYVSASCSANWVYDAGGVWLSSGSASSPRLGGNSFVIQGSAVVLQGQVFNCAVGIALRGGNYSYQPDIAQPPGWPCKEIPTESGEVQIDLLTPNGLFVIARGVLKIS